MSIGSSRVWSNRLQVPSNPKAELNRQKDHNAISFEHAILGVKHEKGSDALVVPVSLRDKADKPVLWEGVLWSFVESILKLNQPKVRANEST